MSLAYKLLYRVGFTPWEQLAKSPLISEQISGLFDREEAESSLSARVARGFPTSGPRTSRCSARSTPTGPA
jgi:hypothetical protein